MPKFLLAGTAVLVLACPAAGATRGHGSDPRDAEIAALRAEVDALRQRPAAEGAARRTTAQRAGGGEQPGAAAQQQPTSALTQAKRGRAPAAPPVPPLAKTPGPGWWGTTT